MPITQGITSRSFQPADLAQDDLEQAQGEIASGVENCTVTRHDGMAVYAQRGLPRNLETSPLSALKHGAKPYSRSQKPGRPGTVRSGK